MQLMCRMKRIGLYATRGRLIKRVLLCACLVAHGTHGLAAEQQWPLTLTLRQERPYARPMNTPGEPGWMFARVMAMHPDGSRLLFLQPLAEEPRLRERAAHGFLEREYRLVWLDLSSGQTGQGIPLTYKAGDQFALSLSPTGERICTIASSDGLILDADFHVVSRFPAHLDTDGRALGAVRCEFFPNESSVLVSYGNVLFDRRRDREPMKYGGALLVHRVEKDKPGRLLRYNAFIGDAIPVSENRAIVMSLPPGQLYL